MEATENVQAAENGIENGDASEEVKEQKSCCLPRKTQKVGNHGISRNKAE